MKIKYIIGDKYPEPEVHLCVKEKNREAEGIYEAIEKLFELRIAGYRGQESELLSPTQIVRIYSENKKVYVRTAEGCYEVKDRLYVLEEMQVFRIRNLAPGLCSILISAAGMIGGIWMDIDSLGGAIKTVARALPFYHGVSLARLPFRETAEGAVEHLLWTVICGVAV